MRPRLLIRTVGADMGATILGPLEGARRATFRVCRGAGKSAGNAFGRSSRQMAMQPEPPKRAKSPLGGQTPIPQVGPKTPFCALGVKNPLPGALTEGGTLLWSQPRRQPGAAQAPQLRWPTAS